MKIDLRIHSTVAGAGQTAAAVTVASGKRNDQEVGKPDSRYLKITDRRSGRTPRAVISMVIFVPRHIQKADKKNPVATG